jgi:hypothetical protein
MSDDEKPVEFRPTSRSGSTTVVALLLWIAATCVAKIEVDLHFDRHAVAEVTTSIGLFNWPNVLLGVALTTPWFAILILVGTVEAAVSLAQRNVFDAIQDAAPFATAAAVVVAGFVSGWQYALVTAFGTTLVWTNRYIYPWWKVSAILLLLLLGFLMHVLDGMSWAPVLRCSASSATDIQLPVRVVLLNRDGTGVVGYDPQTRRVIEVHDCTRDSNRRLTRPWKP